MKSHFTKLFAALVLASDLSLVISSVRAQAHSLQEASGGGLGDWLLNEAGLLELRFGTRIPRMNEERLGSLGLCFVNLDVRF